MSKLSDISIFVTDLDSTLFLPDTTDPPEEFFSLLDSQFPVDCGWIVATGRSFEQVREFSESWPLLPEVIISRERFIHVYRGDDFEPDTRWNEKLRLQTEKVDRDWKKLLPELLRRLKEVGLEPESEHGHLIFESEAEAIKAENFLKQMIDEGHQPLRNRVHLTLAPEEVGKGRCLKRLEQTFSIEKSDVICIGDSANDIDMLDGRYGYLSAAVANAEPIAQKAVKSNNGILLKKPAGHGILELMKRRLED